MCKFSLLASVASFAACALLSACSTRPMYQGPHTANPALIKGKTANIVKLMTEGDSNVSIVEVDGLAVPQEILVGGGGNSAKVDPGRRLITVGLRGDRHVLGQDTFELDVKAGRTYRFTGQKIGYAFDVSVWDETNGVPNRTLVTRRRIAGAAASQQVTLPLFIPVR